MDPVTELGAEDLVDELVLLDPAEAGERGGDDLGAEMLPVAGDVGDVAEGQSGLDALLDLLRWSTSIEPSEGYTF